MYALNCFCSRFLRKQLKTLKSVKFSKKRNSYLEIRVLTPYANLFFVLYLKSKWTAAAHFLFADFNLHYILQHNDDSTVVVD